MHQAARSHSTPARVPHRPLTARQRRQVLEAAVERLLDAVEAALADLDALDGDPDLEPSMGSQNPSPHVSQVCWTAGGDTDEREAVCEGEGDHDEREPDPGDMCNWQDEGDQTKLRQLPMLGGARPSPYPHQNVSGFIPVRAL